MDERLTAVAAMVREGSRVADIGTDHARLPVWLVSCGKCPSAIASDLREGPARSAARNVQKAGLSEQISVRLGDGLNTVQPQEADDIVIAGMGGETIAAILGAVDWVRDPHYRLILQPMTRAEELRKWLLLNGFSIPSEQCISHKRLYTVMTAVYTAAEPVKETWRYYVGWLDPIRDAAYFDKMIGLLDQRLIGLQARGEEDGEEAGDLREVLTELRRQRANHP